MDRSGINSFRDLSLSLVCIGVSILTGLTAGCGGGSNSGVGRGGTPPPTISAVTLTCSTSVVHTASTTQCAASVNGTGSFNTAVAWSVSGVTGGNSSVGTVSSSGLYAAPTLVPTPYTVTVAATSVGDSTKSASTSIIVAGTIASVSSPISASNGGTITLPDGSNVAIAPGVIPADQNVTLTEVSYLPQQPANASVAEAGPGLQLKFEAPIQPAISDSPRQRPPARFGLRQDAAASQSAFLFTIKTPNNNPNTLTGSLPAIAFIDSSQNATFVGADGAYDSTVPQFTAGAKMDLWQAVGSFEKGAGKWIDGVVAGTWNFVSSEGKVLWNTLPFVVPAQLSLSINKGDSSADKWNDYSACPSGKTLLVVHGMNDYVQEAFSTGSSNSPGKIQPIIAAGAYDSVLGFNYDWLCGITSPCLSVTSGATTGAQLATFLTTITACQSVSSLDIEAHSEGVPVSLAALAKLDVSQRKLIRHLIALGGPIMGTPMASDSRVLGCGLLAQRQFNVGENVLYKTLVDLAAAPFTLDLRPSKPGDGSALDEIRTLLASSSIDGAPQIIVVAGNNPNGALNSSSLGKDLSACGALMMADGVSSTDGFIPVTSALAFQPEVAQGKELKVYPLAPFPTDHIDLVSNGNVVSSVGRQVTSGFMPPVLSLSTTPACTDDLVCRAAPATVFTLSGSGYDPKTNHGYELDIFGNIYEHGFSSPNGSIPAGAWQAPTLCFSTAATMTFFAENPTTGLASNAVTAETSTDPCVAIPAITISPTTAQLPVNGREKFTAIVTNAMNTAYSWTVNGISGGSSVVGTIDASGLYTAPAAVPNPSTVTVTATSLADTAVTASASVTVGPFTVKPVYSFSNLNDGAAPSAPLVQAIDTYLYGTAQLGGTYGDGSIFKVDTNGLSPAAPIHDFWNGDGYYPIAPLIQAKDRNFYGTTPNGGTYGGYDYGTVFKVDTSTSPWKFSVLHSFSGGTDGSDSYSGVIQAADGFLYGTTFLGGQYNSGTVFRLDLSGNKTTLYSFTGGTDGFGPGALIQGSDGAFYGGTQNGGDPSCSSGPGIGCGTLFKIDANGNFQILHTFTGLDGAQIDEPLFQSPVDHYFYGTTVFGGDPACTVSTYAGCGTIFRIDASGTFTQLHAFTGGAEGGVPFSSLIQAGDGDFYGTATAGGNSSCSVTASGENYPTYIGCGTVFKMDSAGNVNALYSFTGSPNDGSNPFASVIEGSDGYLYGTTRWGGKDSTCPYTSNGGCGTVFKVAGPGGPLPLISALKAKSARSFRSQIPSAVLATSEVSQTFKVKNKDQQQPVAPLTGSKRPE